MPLAGDERAKLLADAHALIAFLEDHPEVPVDPWDVRIAYSVSPHVEGDAAGRAEVERIADFLGTEVPDRGGSHHTAQLKIGDATYEATYIDRQHMASYTDYMRPWQQREIVRRSS